MRAIVAGSGSEIAQGLTERLRRDGWEVEGATGRSVTVPAGRWDLLLLAHGQLFPIGNFFDCNPAEWIGGVMVNSIYPLSCLRAAWPNRGEKAVVVFLGGPNLSKTSPTYTSYRAGKAMLEALAETLEAEYPEHRFRVLHPGVVKTKIHQQTLQAGRKAANYERVMKIMNGGESTVSHDEVYTKLKGLLC